MSAVPSVDVRGGVSAVILDYGGVVLREASEDWDEVAARYGMPAGWAWRAFHDIPEYALSRAGRLSREEFRAAIVATLARSIGADDAASLHDAIQAIQRS